MKTKEKALELYEKFRKENSVMTANIRAKKQALIAVDEILDITKEEYQIQYTNGEWSRDIGYRYSEFWQQVKQEIEKL